MLGNSAQVSKHLYPFFFIAVRKENAVATEMRP
jgi:hypothetical protein